MGGVDLVHAHRVLTQGFVAATTPFRGVSRVLTADGGDVFGLRGGVLDRFASRALRLADRVTVNSAATEAAVREISGGRAAISRVPIGVDLGRTARPALVNQLRVTYRRDRARCSFLSAGWSRRRASRRLCTQWGCSLRASRMSQPRSLALDSTR